MELWPDQRNRASPSETLRAGAGAAPELAVVCICTLDRFEALERCLSSVMAQELPSAYRFEVTVVDNSSTGNVRDYVEGLAPGFVHYVHERTPGIPFARNAALDKATTLRPSWIAFVDDDCIPTQGWLSRLLQVAAAAGADVMQGGLVRRSGDAKDYAAAWRLPSAPLPARRSRNAATYNVVFRSWIVAEPQRLRFDTNMLESGGSDGEFFMRVGDLGAVIMRTDDAPVVESWEDDRSSSSYLRMRAFRVGANCNYRYRKNRRPAVRAATLILVRAGERLVRSGVRMMHSIIVAPFSIHRARRSAWAGILDLWFAWGCVAPYFGVRTSKYY